MRLAFLIVRRALARMILAVYKFSLVEEVLDFLRLSLSCLIASLHLLLNHGFASLHILKFWNAVFANIY